MSPIFPVNPGIWASSPNFDGHRHKSSQREFLGRGNFGVRGLGGSSNPTRRTGNAWEGGFLGSSPGNNIKEY